MGRRQGGKIQKNRFRQRAWFLNFPKLTANAKIIIMDFCDFIKTRRTVRLFSPQPIDQSILRQLLEVARSAPSAANRQPLEYIIVNDPSQLARIFDQLAWAAYVQPNRNPPPRKKTRRIHCCSNQ